jgi:hypothetical protein
MIYFLVIFGCRTSIGSEHVEENHHQRPSGRKHDTGACGCNDQCGVTSFSYKVGGALSFRAGESHSYGEYPEPGWSDTSLEYEAGVAIRYTVSYQMHYESWTHFFIPATVVTITQLTPVPEPESYAMLGAGLLLLAGVARSKKKAGR